MLLVIVLAMLVGAVQVVNAAPGYELAAGAPGQSTGAG
jgi:hypothetical protein